MRIAIIVVASLYGCGDNKSTHAPPKKTSPGQTLTTSSTADNSLPSTAQEPDRCASLRPLTMPGQVSEGQWFDIQSDALSDISDWLNEEVEVTLDGVIELRDEEDYKRFVRLVAAELVNAFRIDEAAFAAGQPIENVLASEWSLFGADIATPSQSRGGFRYMPAGTIMQVLRLRVTCAWKARVEGMISDPARFPHVVNYFFDIFHGVQVSGININPRLVERYLRYITAQLDGLLGRLSGMQDQNVLSAGFESENAIVEFITGGPDVQQSDITQYPFWSSVYSLVRGPECDEDYVPMGASFGTLAIMAFRSYVGEHHCAIADEGLTVEQFRGVLGKFKELIEQQPDSSAVHERPEEDPARINNRIAAYFH